MNRRHTRLVQTNFCSPMAFSCDFLISCFIYYVEYHHSSLIFWNNKKGIHLQILIYSIDFYQFNLNLHKIYSFGRSSYSPVNDPFRNSHHHNFQGLEVVHHSNHFQVLNRNHQNSNFVDHSNYFQIMSWHRRENKVLDNFYQISYSKIQMAYFDNLLTADYESCLF